MYTMNKRYPDVRALFQTTSISVGRVAEIGGFGARMGASKGNGGSPHVRARHRGHSWVTRQVVIIHHYPVINPVFSI